MFIVMGIGFPLDVSGKSAIFENRGYKTIIQNNQKLSDIFPLVGPAPKKPNFNQELFDKSISKNEDSTDCHLS
jgi:hypothetical protein